MQIAPTGNRGLASQSLQFAPFTAGPFFSIIRFLSPRLIRFPFITLFRSQLEEHDA